MQDGRGPVTALFNLRDGFLFQHETHDAEPGGE
jgi:hypothetical protein